MFGLVRTRRMSYTIVFMSEGSFLRELTVYPNWQGPYQGIGIKGKGNDAGLA